MKRKENQARTWKNSSLGDGCGKAGKSSRTRWEWSIQEGRRSGDWQVMLSKGDGLETASHCQERSGNGNSRPTAGDRGGE